MDRELRERELCVVCCSFYGGDINTCRSDVLTTFLRTVNKVFNLLKKKKADGLESKSDYSWDLSISC